MMVRMLNPRCLFRRILSVRRPHFAETLTPTLTPRFTSCYGHPIIFLTYCTDGSADSTADRYDIARSIADALHFSDGSGENQSLSLRRRLDAHFSHIYFDHSLVRQVLILSSSAGRNILTFRDWLSQHPNGLKTDDTSLSYFIEHLGRRKDFKAIHNLLVAARGIAKDKSFAAAVDRLARAGRPTKLVYFFDNMTTHYGFQRDRSNLSMIVSSLCERGFTGRAERLVKKLADEIFPDDTICDTLIRGWSGEQKLDEARRLMGEVTRGGFQLRTSAYNAMLNCVCTLCRKKDPTRLESELEKVLLDMDIAGIPRDVETFNVLISNYCKIRKTTDALKLFDRMPEWGCSPDATAYLLLIRSLYQAARIGEGDEMIDRMKSSRYGESLDKKAYYGFIKILCGIERVEHALKVFDRMKKDDRGPGVKTYGLLIQKLATRGEEGKANALFKEAVKKGLPIEPNVYQVDPRFMRKTKTVKRTKKRETLSEKMARKRRRLKKLRLSYVKKPKYGMRRI